MKVILLETIRKLGVLGEAVTVAAGYARNYLLPYGKAVPATASNLASFEKQRAELEQKAQERFEEAKEKAETYKDLKVVIRVKASVEGKLFGSIKLMDVLDALASQGHRFTKAQVVLDKAIRDIGHYTYELHLHPDVVLTLPLVVESESSSKS